MRRFFAREIADGISIAKLFVMAAALISLFVDQSFAGVYTAIQNYAGGSLGASADELPWTSIGYNACYYVMILLTPWLIERFGRRIVFSSGHLSYALLSLFLASTPSLHGFMAGRCLQGVAQGTFFVSSVLTVLTLFPPKFTGVAFSVFSVTSLSGAASGTFIGGWFIDHAYWRGALVLYAGLATFASAVIFFFLEAPGPTKTSRFDGLGILSAFVAFFGFQYVAAFGERRDWFAQPDIAIWSVLTVVGFALFIWREIAENKDGFIQLRLFSIRNLAVGSVLGFGLGVPLFGANLFVQFTQQLLAFPPSTAGALLTLRILAIVFVAPLFVLLVNADKVDVRVPVAIGFVLVPVAYAMIALQTTTGSDFTSFAVAIVLSGAGFACLFSPIANALVRSLPGDARAEGIAIFKIVLLLGGSVAATGLQVVYDHSLAAYQTLLAASANLHHFNDVGIRTPSGGLLAQFAQQASLLAYADNSKVVAIATLFNLPLILLLRKPQPPAPAPQQAS